MTQMFWNCSSLTSINFANFDSSSVQDMHLTFAGCIDLKELDLSTFDTSKVTTMYYMFTDCMNLTSLNLGHFDTSKVVTMEAMFCGLYSLKDLHILDIYELNHIKNKLLFQKEKQELQLNTRTALFQTQKLQLPKSGERS